ncbi:hypothetical protein BJX66DRAFT_297814 [Aspergillus keveii]|uniref:Uncharacterized protein n=1 Tax=Aspergillus keveii TaxID=714993 RepID=A0ABR4GEI3_9EURO
MLRIEGRASCLCSAILAHQLSFSPSSLPSLHHCDSEFLTMEHDPFSIDTPKEQPKEQSPTLQHAAVSQAHPPSSFEPTTLSPGHAFSASEPPQENSTPHPRNIFDDALEDYYSQTSKMLPRQEGPFAGSDQPNNNTAIQEHRDSTYSSTAIASSQQGVTVSGASSHHPTW